MRTSVLSLLTTLTILCATTHAAAASLCERLAPLAPYIGTWEINATWAHGTTIWAQAHYESILEGQYIDARVYTRDGDGPLQMRYHTLIGAADDERTFTSHAFKADGTLDVTELRLADDAGVRGLASTWSMGDDRIREHFGVPVDDALHWRVWHHAAGADDETLILDGTWRRVPGKAEPRPSAAPVRPELARLRSSLGSWQVDTTWPDGRTLWARMHARTMPSGNVIRADVHASDDGGPRYHRYREFYIADADGGVHEHVFTYTGTSYVADMTVDPTQPDAMSFRRPPARPGAPAIVKTYTFPDPHTMNWSVRMQLPETEPTPLVDGVWHRLPTETAMTTPIDTSLFAGAGPDVRHFTRTTTIAAPVEDVYAAFSARDAFRSAFDPSRDALEANIDLAVGGRYEWLFDGQLGSNQCQVLSYIPNRMISFSWNAPDTQPESRAQRTWVVVETRATNQNGTDVTLTHLGFGTAPHWDETYEYFGNAWTFVLAQFKTNLEARAETAP